MPTFVDRIRIGAALVAANCELIARFEQKIHSTLARIWGEPPQGFMSQHAPCVAGIDVGGERKGFHAVVLRDGHFDALKPSSDPAALVRWCLDRDASIVAVDAPCAWSREGSSRLAERELKIGGQTIQCFKTPTRERADSSSFYDWVRNGERLYEALANHYALFDGERRDGRTVIETFPNAIVCALAGKVVAAKPKSKTRRDALRRLHYDISGLHNIDFLDASLCALTAERFRMDCWQSFGDKAEGFIVVPKCPETDTR